MTVVVACAACGDAAQHDGTVHSTLQAITGPVKGSRQLGGPSTGSLAAPAYGAGPVISPEIVTLYWGAFSQSEMSTMQSYLTGLVGYMSGATASAGQSPTIFQYGAYGAIVGASYNDATSPPASGTVSNVSTEIATLQSQGHLPAYTPQRVFLAMTKGMDFTDLDAEGFCAEHIAAGAGQYIAISPQPASAGCGSGGAFGVLSSTDVWQSYTSHEIFEAATDPTAFNASAGNQGWAPEIGDGCNWGLQLSNNTRMSFGVVQEVVDGRQGTCSNFSPEQLPWTTAASWGSGRLDTFVVGSADRRAYHKAWDGSEWAPSETSWEAHGGAFQTAPVAISWGPNRVDVFGQSTDNAYYHQAWDGAQWQPGIASWEFHGGGFIGPPAVASWASGHLDIFGRGTDGAMYHQAWDGSEWVPGITGWEYHGGQLTGPVAAVSWGPNRVDLFVEGPDGGYYHQAWDGSTWVPSITGWEAHGNPPNVPFVSPPQIVSWAANRLDVVGLGSDGHYYHQAWDGSEWVPSITGWVDHGNGGVPFVGPASLTSWASGRLDILGEGSDGAAYHQAWDGTEWAPGMSSWEYHHGTFASPPVAKSWGPNRYDFFGPSSGDDALYHQAWNGSAWIPGEETYEFLGGSVQ
jgi:hypothetical protein